jgi:hypothetical protein
MSHTGLGGHLVAIGFYCRLPKFFFLGGSFFTETRFHRRFVFHRQPVFTGDPFLPESLIPAPVFSGQPVWADTRLAGHPFCPTPVLAGHLFLPATSSCRRPVIHPRPVFAGYPGSYLCLFGGRGRSMRRRRCFRKLRRPAARLRNTPLRDGRRQPAAGVSNRFESTPPSKVSPHKICCPCPTG